MPRRTKLESKGRWKGGGDGPIKELRLINGMDIMELVFGKREDRVSSDEEISPAPGEEPSLTNEEDDSLTLLRGRSDTN